MTDPVLHGYWRSSAAYRVRIALALKGVAYTQVAHDLRTGEQDAAEYLAIAPQGLVPALEVDGQVLTQSPAIIEWIDERWPEPPLLPHDRQARATARAMAALIACDVHPLNNLRVLRALRTGFGADQAAVDAWAARWIAPGFAALEQHVTRVGGAYAVADAPGLVDCYLVPQVYSARRFNVDLAPYPRLMRAHDAAAALPAVMAAHPDRQPDADKA